MQTLKYTGLGNKNLNCCSSKNGGSREKKLSGCGIGRGCEVFRGVLSSGCGITRCGGLGSGYQNINMDFKPV